MKKNNFIVAMAIVGAFSLVNGLLYAEAWNWHRPFKTPGRNIETLVITGNYRQPRLIADLFQNETNQPIIVLPSDGSDRAYFLSGNRSDKTLVIEKKNFANFVKFCNPKLILIIGDKHYTPDGFIDLINARQTKVRINNKYWLDVVKTIHEFFGLTYIERDFKQQVELINSGKLYQPAENDAIPVSTIESTDRPAASTITTTMPIEKINDDDYTPPPFVLKGNTKVTEKATDILIEEPVSPPQPPPVATPKEIIPSEDKKVIENKSVSEPKLIDENKFKPSK
jgi:hypothetical protein